MAAGADSVPIQRLEEERRRSIEEVHQVEQALGERPRGLSPTQLSKRRETLKARLKKAHRRLGLANAAIKQGRRAGQALLLNGIERPRNERELVATLYRMLVDVLPPAEQTEDQRIIGRIARDYVQNGVIQ